MGLIEKILGRIQTVVATYHSGTKYDLSEAVRSGTPVLLVVTGYGVITKDEAASPDIAAQVTAEGSGFIWSRREGKISFVREQQVGPLREALAKTRILEIHCSQEAYDPQHSVGVREFIRPTARGSMLCGLLAARLRLPILGIVLVMLAANALVGPGIKAEAAALRAEADRIEQQLGHADESLRRRHEALAGFHATLPHSFAWLCDRAAAALPGPVRLTSMVVQPLARNLEDGKRAEVLSRMMLIAGESPDSESITSYVAALQNARIASMEYDKEQEAFTFYITIEL